MTGTTLAQAIPILASPLLTRLYTPDQYGTSALFMAIVTVCSVIATFRYELSIMLPAKDEDAINIFALAIFISVALSIFFLFIIAFFNKVLVSLLHNADISIWLYFVPLMVLLIGLYQCMYYWMSRNREYNRLATGQVTRSGVKTGTQVGAAYIIPTIGTPGLIIGAITGQFIATIVLWIQAGKEITSKLKYINKATIFNQAKGYKNFPLINSPHALVNNLSSNLPVMLLTGFFSSKVAGFYSLSLAVVMTPVSLIGNAIGQVFYQRISNAYNNGEKLFPLVTRLIKGLFLIAVIPFFLLFILAPYIFTFIFGQEWKEAGRYTCILIPWVFMVFLVAPLSYLPITLGYQKKAFIIEIIGICTKFLALFIGSYFQKSSIALMLFSLSGFLILAYSFIWIINISKREG